MSIDLSNSSLAINGGTPVRTKPWLDNYTTGEEEKRAALAAMDTGYLSKFEGSFTPDPPFSFNGGPYVQQLEEMWSEYYDIKYSISVNSATSGLYAAIGALELGYGDEIIVSPSTMTASSIGPLLYGAIPIFADIEPMTGALDPASIQSHITPRTKCIIVVHQYGIPADMDAIMSIAKRHNIKVIEDCAQAHGAKYNGQYVGTFGDIGVFSLNVNKTIQSGEGGVCTTNNEDLKFRLELIRNHGENVVGPAGYTDITNLIGYNYRITEVQAAIAIEQLKKLDYLNEVRIGYVDYLNAHLEKFDFIDVIRGREGSINTFYTFPFYFKPEVAGVDIESFLGALNSDGMYLYRGYKPLYHQPVYQRKEAFKHGYPFAAPENQDSITNYHYGSCPVSEDLYNKIVISEHVRLPNTMEDMKDIVTAIGKVAGKAYE